MKDNSLRILTWLYPKDNQSRWVDVEELALFLPNMTPAGLQSSLFFLQQKKQLVLEKIDLVQAVSITSHGKKSLEKAIPAFSQQRRQWRGEWWAIVFLQAPKHDKNFRFLRRVLLAEHSLPLTRGIFLFPGQLSEKISYELRNSYEGNVMVAPFKNWTFGDDKEIIGSILEMSDLANSYSSISKEITSLLEKETNIKGLSDQSKIAISSVFDRLYNSLKNDFGILHEYYPYITSGVDLVFSLQPLSSMG
jgi:DNA-binding transcriptional regulator PaaX